MKSLLLIAALFAGPVCAADRFDIAVTVDDLPAHGLLPPGQTRLSIAEDFLQALKTHGVGEAYGFVNAEKLKDAGGEAVLDTWRSAGQPLANHTWSHLNIDRAPSLEAWQENVRLGEPAVAARMQGEDWHWLRYPNLSTGATVERHDGGAAFLTARGYRIAHVSLSFDDWAYTDAYARCAAKGDEAAISAMETQYLKAVDDGILRMKATSKRVYGRMIPQVLLTHLGGWSSRTMPAVLAKLDAAGARYVPLEDAQKDPAYAEAEAYLGGDGIMERAARNKHIDLKDIPGQTPRVDLAAVCA